MFLPTLGNLIKLCFIHCPILGSTYNPLFYSVDCNNNFYNPPNVQPFPPYSANGAESEHFPKIPPVTTAAAYETFSSYPGEFKSEFSSSLAKPTTDGSIESPANGMRRRGLVI